MLGFLTMGLQTWLPQGVNNYRDAVLFGIVILVLLVPAGGAYQAGLLAGGEVR